MRAARHGLLISFLFSYLLVLFIPLVISGIALTEAEGIVEAYTIENSMNLLEQIRDLLDVNTEELKKIAIRIAMDSRVKKLSGVKVPEGDTYYTIWELSRDLQAFQFLEETLVIPIIYFPHLDMVVSPPVSCPFLTFYNYHFKHEDLTGEEWRRMLTARYYPGEFLPMARINFGGNDYSVLSYLQSLPLGYTHRCDAIIIILVDAARLGRLLERIRLYDYGWASVSDGQGRILAMASGPKAKPTAVPLPREVMAGHTMRKIAKRSMMVIHTISEKNGWRYAAVLPAARIMGRVRYVRVLTLGAACLSLILGLLIAYYLARRNVKPLREIVEMMTNLFGPRIEKSGTEYDMLRNTLGAISAVLGDNRSLQQSMERQKPLVRAAVFDRLFKGYFRDKAELEALMNHIGLEIKGKNFAVLIIRISGLGDRTSREELQKFDVIRSLIEEALKKFTSLTACVHHVEQDRFTVLLCYKNEDQQICIQQTNTVIQAISFYLWGKYNIKAWFALGRIFTDLTDIYKSYEEARQASSFQQMHEDDICVWSHEIPNGNTKYYYPIELEERLIRLTQLGDREEVQRILQDIYHENFVQRKLSTSIAGQLLQALNGTLYRIIDEQTQNMLESIEISSSVNISSCYQKLVANYLTVSQIITERRQANRKSLVKKIIKYIECHYAETDLCLMAIAETFKLSTAYISQVFKEEMGKNFSDYLEEIRMTHACRLLSTTGLGVAEIAAQSGYGSDKAFRRAFKRVKGMSPTEFRKTVFVT